MPEVGSLSDRVATPLEYRTPLYLNKLHVITLLSAKIFKGNIIQVIWEWISKMGLSAPLVTRH
jgi:hypothetical protein